MKREIKFRAKRVDNDEWAYGGVIICDDYCIIDQGHEVYIEEEYEHNGDTHYFNVAGVMCQEDTICQFTGLKDKNGKEIYEGDILMCVGKRSDNYGKKYYRKVLFHDGSFCMIDPESRYENSLYNHVINDIFNWEIVGNIYDNPELMKED